MSKEGLFFTLPVEGHLSSNTPCLLNSIGRVTVPRPVRMRSDILEGGTVNMHDLRTGIMLTFRETEAAYYEKLGVPAFGIAEINKLGLVALPKDLLPKWNMQQSQMITYVDLLGPVAYFADATNALCANLFLHQQEKSLLVP